MQKNNKRQAVLGDIKGGLTAALSALPVELVYGLFAVAPLGLAYAEAGMRAALWGCILGGALTFLLRGTAGLLTGTRPATGLILAALATELLAQPSIQAASDPAAYVFTLLLLCTALAGFFQLLFGLARIGRMINYIPYPVIAGLMLGVGILMLRGSLRPALGASDQTAWIDLFTAWHPASVVVTGVSLSLCYLAPRWKSPIPGTILALVIGTALHQLLALSFDLGQLGSTLANISGLMPKLTLLNAGIGWQELFAWLPFMATYALTIATLGSLEALLCLSALGNVRAQRPNTHRSLSVLGLANLFSGLAGATPSLGNLPRVNANLAAGGQTTFSNLVYALSMAIIVIVLGGYLSLVPRAVTAAIVIYYAIALVDDGTRRIVHQVITLRKQAHSQHYRMLVANLGVIVIVAAVAVVGDMMKAVGIGIAAAVLLFVRSRMKPVIRRVTQGDRRRSTKIRTAQDSELLDREGRQITVIEADGPLFFGTADSIAIGIEKYAAQSSLIILDLKHARDIDTTGARTLLQTSRKLVAQKKALMISGASGHFENLLKAMGLGSAIPSGNWHYDLDQALEDAEDRLLARLGANSSHRALALSETALVAGLSPQEIDILATVLHTKDFPAAIELFKMGDEGDSLFVASACSVDILIPLTEGKHKRVVSLAPGTFFGEMAVLEGRPRSATAYLTGPSLVWELTLAALDQLLASHPSIARQVLFNISCQLAGRLRVVTDELMAVEADS